ncbi:plasmid recombination protein [Pseudoduganella danionis]|nr:plasmid recombination protein [Pseudoduganella danionis]
MTAESHFLRVKKLVGAGIVRAAAKHNLREIAAELGADGHIDVSRIVYNLVLAGADSAEMIAKESQTALKAAGVTKLRRDAVRVVELVFSLPLATQIDQRQFFVDAVSWAGEYFKVPILSAVVHNDESAPHCHVLLLPLVDGRMVGSDLVGGRHRLVAMQDDFYSGVAAKYGLSKPTPQKRISATERQRALALIRECLHANSGLQDNVIDALLAPHGRDPVPLMLALGIDLPEPEPKKGGFVQMMTKPCKPERKSRNLGFADTGTLANDETLCSVGFAPSAPSKQATQPAQQQTEASPQAPADNAPEASLEPASIELAHVPQPMATDDRQHDSEFTRESLDQPAELWDSDTGDWIRPPARKASHRALAGAAVSAVLAMSRSGVAGPYAVPYNV